MGKCNLDCDNCELYANYHGHYEREKGYYEREYTCFVTGKIITVKEHNNGKIEKTVF